MAIATLAVGMVFIGGTFLAGVFFATLATERTIAATVADEAFAKVELYGFLPAPDLRTDRQIPFAQCNPDMPPYEFGYPSTRTQAEKQYYWSALCKESATTPGLVQVTVFVSRKVGAGAEYWDRQNFLGGSPDLQRNSFPRPIPVNVIQDPSQDRAEELRIIDAVPGDAVDERAFINDGYTVVDGQTGQIYRVLERRADQPDKIVLDRPWQGGAIAPPAGNWVWVVGPPIGGGKYPCIAVYQKVF